MPTYEYQCPEGHAFDKFQKMTDKPRAKCPTCGKTATRKISGGAALVFKGSGFYITDYGKDGKKDQRKQAPPEGSKSDSGGSSSEGSPKSSDKPSKGSGSDKPSKGSGSSDA